MMFRQTCAVTERPEICEVPRLLLQGKSGAGLRFGVEVLMA